MRASLSRITIFFLIAIISGCRVRTTTDRLSEEGFNRPRAQTVTTTTTARDNPTNNNPSKDNNSNSNNSNLDNNSPVDIPVSNPPANNRSNDRSNNPPSNDDIKVSIPKLFIKIFAKKVPESSSAVGLLSFGILSSIYLYKRKEARKKN